MQSSRTEALRYADEQHRNFLEELIEFCKIPSISNDPSCKGDIERAAAWLAGNLSNAGLSNVQILPTGGHPVVYAEHLEAGPTAPTALIYGHYDVQPVEPLELWETGPFEPGIRGENIYARGVTDMKGQIMASVKAVQSIIKTGALPINLKFIIEGEEEIGSPNLAKFITDHKELLACDFAINPDTGMIAKNVPTITYGLRGLAYFELRITGPDHDLHSGIFGGAVHNPIAVLCSLIAGMHNQEGQITLPGFYDSVRPLTEEERAELRKLPTNEEVLLELTGAPALWGEEGYHPVEQVGARPSLDINGIYSGYTAPGAKTVLPSKAMAKVSMRLVPDQQPDEIHQQLLSYLEQNAPATVRWELDFFGGSPPSISDRQSTAVQALAKAMETVWGVEPVFKREGGSVPVVGMFQKILGVESVNTGFSLPGDNMHSPNEKMHLPTWKQGTAALIHYFFNLAEVQ
jgi:acetylornithine deacetylase/succinyl-diaminopimelate desuccinylase-like protein